MTLTIVIPTLNEARNIAAVLERLAAVRFPVPCEVIVVDDHSTDGTFGIEETLRRRLAPALPIMLLRQGAQRGRGACIRAALPHATGDWLVVQDGDLEYDPQDLVALAAAAEAGRADLICGSRFLRRRWPHGMAWPNFIANHLLTWLVNRLYGLRLTDAETCYKMIARDRVSRLALRADGFEFDLELLAKLAKQGARLLEVPIGYEGRSPREGKKIGARDFFIAIWTLLRHRA